MLSLKGSMELAGQNLIAILASPSPHLPYWAVRFDHQKKAECQTFWPSHNTGRWWDALLRLEAATGFAIPAEASQAMLANLNACLDNPYGMGGYLIPRVGIPPGPDPAGWFDNHSQREILLALAALVRYRNLDLARDLGIKMVRALDRFILPDGDWDYDRMESLCQQAGIVVTPAILEFYKEMGGFRHIESHGRLIEALLEFHLAIGDDVALVLAGRLAHFHLDVSTRADGSLPTGEHTHTHSYLGTLRGLLMFGQLTRQHQYVERVALTYRETVRKTIKLSGFISHDFGKETDGEVASAGDVAQLAMRLATSGYPEFLDDAERIVRARLLPSQITETIGLQPANADGLDEHANLDRRALGAFAGLHLHTHGGKLPITDITAATLHTMCDIYTHIAEETPLGLQVNFHFDYDSPRLTIRSIRGQTASLEIQHKDPRPLLVRIPGWVVEGSIRLGVNEKPVPIQWAGPFLYVPRQEGAAHIRVEYGLPETESQETTDGVTYRIKWRGDEIVGISPNTDWLPFYPDS